MTGYTAKVGLRKPPINGGYIEGPATPVPTHDPHWLMDQIYRAAAALDGLPPEMRETMAHRTRLRDGQVDGTR